MFYFTSNHGLSNGCLHVSTLQWKTLLNAVPRN